MQPTVRGHLAIYMLFAVCFVTVLTLFVTVGGRMSGDGQNYYIYLRSLVFDRDLDLRNDYEMFPRDDPLLARIYICSKGKPPNLFSFGPALLWAPFFLVARGISAMMPPTYEGNTNLGKGEPYYLAVCLASVLASFAGILATFKMLNARFGAKAAALGTLGTWLAGSALYYQIFEPFMSHALSLFAVSIFIAKAAHCEHFTGSRDWLVLGALAGLMTLVRWQNIIFTIVPALLIITQSFAHKDRRRLPIKGIALAATTALVAFSPQMIVWERIFGKPLLIPQGGAFINLGQPHILSALFSPRCGLFLWMPIALLGTIGLIASSLRADRLGLALLVAFLAQLYINSAVLDWWGGEGFGGRRFVGCYPIFAYGLAFLASASLRTRRFASEGSGSGRIKLLVGICALLIFSNSILASNQTKGRIRKETGLTAKDFIAQQLETARDWLVWLGHLPQAIRTAYTLDISIKTAFDALDLAAATPHRNISIDLGSQTELAALDEGWYNKERWADTPFRWSRKRSAIAFRSGISGPACLLITARTPAGRESPGLSVWLNGKKLGYLILSADWAQHALPCPMPLLRLGLNSLRLDGPKPQTAQASNQHPTTIPGTQVQLAKTINLVSSDCSEGLISKIAIGATDVSPNRFGINVVAVDTPEARLLFAVSLPFGAPIAAQQKLINQLQALPDSAIILVSTRVFGLLHTQKDWFTKILRMVSSLHGRNYFSYAGIGALRIFVKNKDGTPRIIGDFPVADPTGPNITSLNATLRKLSAPTIYVATLAENETPLCNQLISQFQELHIDITIPDKFRIPFVAVGGRFKSNAKQIKRAVERGTARLVIGPREDPRALSFAVDRIEIVAASAGG